MGSPNQLSFLPDDYLEKKSQRRTNAIFASLFLLVMGGIGSAFVLNEQQTKRTDEEYAQVDLQYVAEAKRIEQARQMADKQKRISQQADLAASLLERAPRYEILKKITDCTEPTGVSLIDLTLESKVRVKPASNEPARTAYEQKKAARQSADQKAAAPVDLEPRRYDVQMKLSGVARSDVQVAQFLDLLQQAKEPVHQSRIFKEVNLLISDEHKVGEEKLRRFQMELVLAPDIDLRSKDGKRQQTAAVAIEKE